MSNDSVISSAFKQILLKLEEEHLREVSQLRKEHSRELLQLRAELECNYASLGLQGAAQQAPSPKFGSEEPKFGSEQSSPRSPSSIEVEQAGPIHNADQCSRSKDTSDQASRLMEDDHLSTIAEMHTVDKFPSQLGQSCLVGKYRESKIKEDHHILANIVNENLDKVSDPVTVLLDKYAKSRGWSTSVDHATRVTRLQRCVSHPKFDIACASAIILNTALLGATTSFRAQSLDVDHLPLHYEIGNNTFSLWFLVELMLRWKAEGLIFFVTHSPNVSWNLFDIFVVGTDILDLTINVLTGGENKALASLNVMRMLRALRVARTLRVVRLVKFCSELRVMVFAVFRSGRTLFWCMVVISIIFYIFGIFIMQAVTQHRIEREADLQILSQAPHCTKESGEGKLGRCFGSLTMTFYTLFQVVSGGVSWGEIADPLLETGTANAIVFCLFVFFTVFAMLNIITGFFVESAFNTVKQDYDEVVHEEQRAENSSMRQLYRLFQQFDPQGQGWIDEATFAKLAEDTRARALLSSLGLKVSESKGLFALVDLEHTGRLFIDDFIIGCLKLRGGAQEVDLISLMYESRKLLAAQHKMSRFMHSEFERLGNFEERVEIVLTALSAIPGLLSQQHSRVELSSKLQL